tara:strand:- start:94 stop:537 length:444 start_codon:yes stop_codon:yes gene_type:complete
VDSDDLFRTNVGLTYFRQVRDGKQSMPKWITCYRDKESHIDILHNEIRRIETFAEHMDKNTRLSRMVHPNIYDNRKYCIPPFNALPCHRDIVVEIRGEEWVLERERKKEEFERIQKLVGPERETISAQREEARKKKREARLQWLRDL